MLTCNIIILLSGTWHNMYVVHFTSLLRLLFEYSAAASALLLLLRQIDVEPGAGMLQWTPFDEGAGWTTACSTTVVQQQLLRTGAVSYTHLTLPTKA